MKTMTPIRFITRIIDDRRRTFRFFSNICMIPLYVYIIIDILGGDFPLKVAVGLSLMILIKIAFYYKIKTMDFNDKIEANERLQEENNELAQILLQNKMYKVHHLKDIIIELAKELQKENSDE